MKTERYTGYTAKSISLGGKKILFNSADIKVNDEEIIVYLKKKNHFLCY